MEIVKSAADTAKETELNTNFVIFILYLSFYYLKYSTPERKIFWSFLPGIFL
jgi:hypothetical protein